MSIVTQRKSPRKHLVKKHTRGGGNVDSYTRGSGNTRRITLSKQSVPKVLKGFRDWVASGYGKSVNWRLIGSDEKICDSKDNFWFGEKVGWSTFEHTKPLSVKEAEKLRRSMEKLLTSEDVLYHKGTLKAVRSGNRTRFYFEYDL